MIHEQDRMSAMMGEILGDRLVKLTVVAYDAHEDFSREETRLTCRVKDKTSGEEFAIEGKGVGLIDAFFHGVLARMSQEYPSLQTIAIDKFMVTGKIGGGRAQNRTDAPAEVVLGIRNSQGSHFEFTAESRSVTRSGLEATLRACEYFVNSERAFIEVYRALKASREQNRQDLVSRYTSLMAQLVKNTSYSETIEQIRADLDRSH